MPLRIRLSAGEEFIVNGAVLRNGDRRTILTVANAANIIKAKDVMFAEQATTPVRKAYFLIQSILMSSGDDKSGVKGTIHETLAGLFHGFECDEARAIILRVVDQFTAEDYYKALSALRELMPHEDALLSRQGKENTHVNTDKPAGSLELVR